MIWIKLCQACPAVWVLSAPAFLSSILTPGWLDETFTSLGLNAQWKPSPCWRLGIVSWSSSALVASHSALQFDETKPAFSIFAKFEGRSWEMKNVQGLPFQVLERPGVAVTVETKALEGPSCVFVHVLVFHFRCSDWCQDANNRSDFLFCEVSRSESQIICIYNICIL